MVSPDLQVLPLTPEHLDDVSRLHKFSCTGGGSVFAAHDLSEVLAAAASQQHGAFGFVALLCDPEDPDEPELVGALTAQHSTPDDPAAGGGGVSGAAGVDGDLQEAAAAAAAAALGGVADPELLQQVAAAISAALAAAGEDEDEGVEGEGCGGQDEASQVVLLTLVVRADARRQRVATALLRALLHSVRQTLEQQQEQQQQQQQEVGPSACMVVADVSLANQQAWAFFERAGFSQGPPTGNTAEAMLLLQHPQQQQGDTAASFTPAAAAAVAPSGTTAAAAVLQDHWQQPSWLSAPVGPRHRCSNSRYPNSTSSSRGLQQLRRASAAAQRHPVCLQQRHLAVHRGATAIRSHPSVSRQGPAAVWARALLP